MALPSHLSQKVRRQVNRIYPVSGRAMKDKVSLLGFALPTRDLTPWNDPDMDFWGLNERYNHGNFQIDKASAWFQIHPLANCMRPDNNNDLKHPEWLRAKHDFPIFMQQQYEDVPSSVKFPLAQCNQYLNRPAGYYSSGVAYMLVLAMYLGFQRIELYGIQMETETEYFKQRPNLEYLIGYGRAKGIDIYLPEACSIARSEVYAYKSLDTPFRQQLEWRKKTIEKSMEKVMGDLNKSLGNMQTLDEIRKMTPEERAGADWEAKWEEAHKAAELHKQELNATHGGAQENAWVTKAFDISRAAEGVMFDESQTTSV
jgi:hypothetical protein